MRKNIFNRCKNSFFTLRFSLPVLLVSMMLTLTGCSDEPTSDNYAISTGEVVTEWLDSHSDYSIFRDVVDVAGLRDQLSAYGSYTCFVPTNEAFGDYLAAKGMSLEQLLADKTACDVIAKTHVISVMYLVAELKDGPIAQQNMNRRTLKVSHENDDNDNSITVINNVARLYFELQDDTVENGVMHPVNTVIESSTNMLPELIATNPRVSLYAQAFQLTGVADQMNSYKDNSYNKDDYADFYDYKSGAEPEESATPPDEKLYGFTAFLVPDEVLKEKYGITDIKGLYDLAADLYKNDEYYRNDVGTAGWSFENLTDSVNPLRRFMQYHVVNRKFPGYDQITVRDDLGVIKSKNNPTDWYPTLLFSSIAKFEHLTAQKWASTEADLLSQHTSRCRYINRHIDDNFTTNHGIHIQEDVSDAENDALNGIYFYIDDVMVFDRTSDVYNCRMRMDFSTLFPELITNNIRMNGDETVSREANDHTNKYGRNYYFPSWKKDGVEVNYLDGVSVGGNGKFIYRRPRKGYWSMHGDEFICQGNYDVKFKLPMVPYEGDWQIRLGYAAMPGLRGVCQIYFADPDKEEPQGIPLDMNKTIYDILGDNTLYSQITSETKRLERRKTLKNNGYYYGANGAYHGDNETATFADVCTSSGSTLRIVLCTKHMKPGVDYYIRMRAVSSKQGNDNEGMFDYIEMVPKSVYGVNDDSAMEDDL